MRLTIDLPTGRYLEQEVVKVKATGHVGEFTLLPRHIDHVTTLEPGLFTYYPELDDERFVALDTGLLVMIAGDVRVATLNAVAGGLGELEVEVRAMVDHRQDRERAARSAVARLEADFVHRFTEFGKI